MNINVTVVAYIFIMFCVYEIKKCKLVAVLIAFIVVICGILLNKSTIQVSKLVEREKCPFCYGLTACPLVDEGHLEVRHTTLFSAFNHFFDVKNVYYGIYGEIDVVFKKLAYNWELEGFDSKLCKENDSSELCVNQKMEIMDNDFYSKITKALTSDMLDLSNKMRLCPDAENLNVLLNKVIVERDYLLENIWTLIKINPEPLILDILPAEDNWPVPKFFGSCGRLAIVENVGPLLSTYINAPWKHRSKIASSLFNAAEMLTFRNAQFSFYLTDISMDNIAVDSNNNAKFIDLENIIIVDRNNSKERTSEWSQVHSSEIHVDCQDCFIFSPFDICSHNISDHNYYAICWHILVQGWTKDSQPQGFLHDIPDNIRYNYPMLINLLQQCSKPDSYQERITAGSALAELLYQISQNETM